ncbi:MAG: hypothetical protein RLZZ511_1481 [Cyanobacteriota bacterium]|jgi:hypothetical protein
MHFAPVLTYGLLALYAFVMPVLFTNWYGLYLQETRMTVHQRQISRIVLIIATLLWPIVLPMTYVELLQKIKRYERRSARITAQVAAASDY